jgi:hypothetical protein
MLWASRRDVVPLAIEELDVSPALIGIIAGVGGASPFVGAAVATARRGAGVSVW